MSVTLDACAVRVIADSDSLRIVSGLEKQSACFSSPGGWNHWTIVLRLEHEAKIRACPDTPETGSPHSAFLLPNLPRYRCEFYLANYCYRTHLLMCHTSLTKCCCLSSQCSLKTKLLFTGWIYLVNILLTASYGISGLFMEPVVARLSRNFEWHVF